MLHTMAAAQFGGPSKSTALAAPALTASQGPTQAEIVAAVQRANQQMQVLVGALRNLER
jgi:hypothetical protein